MSLDHDPLLRATADGDTACPDGESLARLGQHVREALSPPNPIGDLAPGVLTRLGFDEADADPLTDEAIDAFYDGDGRDEAGLGALASLIRNASEPAHRIDLDEQVRLRLAGSLRLGAQRALDLGSRWRIWSTVVAGHIAALLAIAAWQFHRAESEAVPEVTEQAVVGNGIGSNDIGLHGTELVDLLRPASWADAHRQQLDLFAPRRTATSRSAARAAAGLEASGPLVADGLRWLIAQQDSATGHFGTSVDDENRDLASQSVAVLALLGEGVDDPIRAEAARRGLLWIIDHAGARIAERDPAAAGMAALVLTEGATLLGDDTLRAAAGQVFDGFESHLPSQPGPSGLAGFAWLAIETADNTDLRISGHIVAAARNDLRNALPDGDASTGHVGLAAYARLILGYHHLTSTRQLLDELGRTHRLPRVDLAGRIDPLGSWFATLAVHQAGGPLWRQWSAAIDASTTASFITDGDLAWVPSARVRFAEAVPNGDIFATAVTLLQLQVPYRSIAVGR